MAEFTGINTSTISDWKRKGNTPSANNISKICEFLGVSTYWLLTGEDNEESEIVKTFTKKEIETIKKMRKLSYEALDDIYDIIDMKYNKTVKKGRSSILESGKDEIA